MILLRWWRRFWWRGNVSAAWLEDTARRECVEGWDGPRWRFPVEQREVAQRERLKRIAALRSDEWERKQA